PAGEAAYNPLYALRLALRADGVAAVSRQRLDLAAHPLAGRDTLLVLGDPDTLAPGDVDALLAWVEGGGHLLLSTPRVARPSRARAGALLSRLGVEPQPGGGGCERLHLPGREPHAEFCGRTRFIPRGSDPEHAWGDLAAGYVYARLRRGEGAVDVLASLDFMGNGKLAEPPHAALARQLLDRNYGQGTVHLVYAAHMPALWRLLLERGWRGCRWRWPWPRSCGCGCSGLARCCRLRARSGARCSSTSRPAANTCAATARARCCTRPCAKPSSTACAGAIPWPPRWTDAP